MGSETLFFRTMSRIYKNNYSYAFAVQKLSKNYTREELFWTGLFRPLLDHKTERVEKWVSLWSGLHFSKKKNMLESQNSKCSENVPN